MPLGGLPVRSPNARTVLGTLPLLLWFACDDGQTVESTVDARPGIEQVGSAEGPLLDEDEACAALRDALLDSVDSNGCDEVVVPACPELIRPGGSLACLRFSEDSVSECVDSVREYDSCRDFVREACVVVAVVGETSDGCVPPGPDDDAGADDDAGLADDDFADDDFADDDLADDDPDAGDDDASDDDTSADGGELPSDGGRGNPADSGSGGPEAGPGPDDSGPGLAVDSGGLDATVDASP